MFELIKLPLEGVSLYNGLLDALEDVLINKPTDYNTLVSFVNYLEKYLALLGNLTCKTAAITKPLTLMPLIKNLILSEENQTFKCYVRAHIDAFQDQPNFLAHICRAYCTRNEVDHTQAKDGRLPDWANDQAMILQNRNSILVVFLYASLLHYQALKTAIEEKQLSEQPDIVPYLQRVIDDFRKWQQRFVATHSTEKIVQLYAREEVDIDDQDRQLREGYVEQLRQQISELQLMLLGEAGMGKTTTVQYLTLIDAEKCLQAPRQEDIPIYIELKLLTDSTLWQ
jgi:predicted NACHT family NTPase